MTLDQESERFKLVQSLSEGDHGSTLQAVHSPEHQRLIDQLGFMFLTAPHFEDIEFPGQSIDTVFLQLNEGLSRVRNSG